MVFAILSGIENRVSTLTPEEIPRAAAQRPIPSQRHAMKYPVLLFVALLLSGCSTMKAVEEQTYFELGSQPILYRDQWARRDPPQVHVRPKEAQGSAPSALFVPFRVTQPITNPEIIGYTQARILWQTWLSMQIFPVMEFTVDSTPYRRDRALALARGKGADIVVGGFVTYYFAGGSAGDSQVALQVEIHDVHSGELVWSMAQSALMPAGLNNDFLLFATKTRLPSDPMFVLTKTMAEDMGMVIRNSLNPPAPASGLQRLDNALHRAWRGEDRSNPKGPLPQPAEAPAF